METLADLRPAVLEWLDNPSGDLFAPGGDYGRIDRLINEAYRAIVKEVYASNKPWNVNPDTVTISVTSAATEYTVNGTDAQGNPNVRKPIDATRTDLAGGPYKYDTVPYSDRFRMGTLPTRHLPRLRSNLPGAIYFYRRSSAVWILGFTDQSPETQTCVVTYEPTLNKLVAAGDVPTQVPADYHSLIAVKAALLGFSQTDREMPETLQLHHDRLIVAMRDELGSVAGDLEAMRF